MRSYSINSLIALKDHIGKDSVLFTIEAQESACVS